jgi:hypothetical protein
MLIAHINEDVVIGKRVAMASTTSLARASASVPGHEQEEEQRRKKHKQRERRDTLCKGVCLFIH